MGGIGRARSYLCVRTILSADGRRPIRPVPDRDRDRAGLAFEVVGVVWAVTSLVGYAAAVAAGTAGVAGGLLMLGYLLIGAFLAARLGRRHAGEAMIQRSPADAACPVCGYEIRVASGDDGSNASAADRGHGDGRLGEAAASSASGGNGT